MKRVVVAPLALESTELLCEGQHQHGVIDSSNGLTLKGQDGERRQCQHVVDEASWWLREGLSTLSVAQRT